MQQQQQQPVWVNGRQNKDADDDVQSGVGERQRTLLVRNVTDKRMTP